MNPGTSPEPKLRAGSQSGPRNPLIFLAARARCERVRSLDWVCLSQDGVLAAAAGVFLSSTVRDALTLRVRSSKSSPSPLESVVKMLATAAEQRQSEEGFAHELPAVHVPQRLR